MATTHDRALTTFDAKSRQILANGGTVVGGNGGTYKYDPLTGLATVIRWRDGTVPAQTGTTAAPRSTSATPVLSNPNPRPNLPGKRVGEPGANPQQPSNGVDPVPKNDPITGIPGGTPFPGSTDPATGAAPGAGGAVEDPLNLEDPNQAAIDEAKRLRQNDARARILSVLAEYGLESLADFVWQQILAGKSDAEVLQDIRNTQQFKDRFPAIEARTKAGLAPISPGEYVAYERQARQIMRASGLPENFYDSKDDFTRFLVGDVSISELNDRVQLGKQAAFEAPAEVREMLVRDYGMTEGDLTAFFLDEKAALPLLEKKYRAAQIGGAGVRTGFGSTRVENERLADLGITAGQAEQGFGVLSDSQELFGALDRGEDTISRTEQIGAALEGNSAARRRIEQRRRRRQSQFESGGSFASGQTGVSGLGDTSDF